MLSSKERAKLRALASKEDAILQIGKGGINDNLIKQVDDALKAREIVKLTVLETSPLLAKEAAESLALSTNSDVVQTIGFKIVLYRKKPPEKKVIVKKKPTVAAKKVAVTARESTSSGRTGRGKATENKRIVTRSGRTGDGRKQKGKK